MFLQVLLYRKVTQSYTFPCAVHTLGPHCPIISNITVCIQKTPKYPSIPLPPLSPLEVLWKTVWRYLKKLNIELPSDPVIPLLDIYLDKPFIQKDTCIPMFTAALFTIFTAWKQPKYPSTDEWIKKMWYIYAMEYYSAIKKTT